MQWPRTLLQPRCLKLWLIGAIGVLLILNVAAVQDRTPDQWEYKTIWFRVNASDNLDTLQARFTAALNQEGAGGWEYVGRCGHTNSLDSWVDYVVFKRPRW